MRGRGYGAGEICSMATEGFKLVPFLHIPVETRLRIYGYVFAESQVSLQPASPGLSDGGKACYAIGCKRHQLLLVCRKTYLEGRCLWYSSTTWTFKPDTVRPFLDDCRVQPYLAHIKHVQLQNAHDLTQLWTHLLSSLQSVVVDIERTYLASREVLDGMNERALFERMRFYILKTPSVKCLINNFTHRDATTQSSKMKASLCLQFRLAVMCMDQMRFAAQPHQPSQALPKSGTHIEYFLVDLDKQKVESSEILAAEWDQIWKLAPADF